MHDLIDVYNKHIEEDSRPSVGEFVQLLQSVIWGFSKVFIVVYALDKYSDANDARHILLTEIRKLLARSCLLVYVAIHSQP